MTKQFLGMLLVVATGNCAAPRTEQLPGLFNSQQHRSHCSHHMPPTQLCCSRSLVLLAHLVVTALHMQYVPPVLTAGGEPRHLHHSQSTPPGAGSLALSTSSNGLEPSPSINAEIREHHVIVNSELVLKEVIGSGAEGKVCAGSFLVYSSVAASTDEMCPAAASEALMLTCMCHSASPHVWDLSALVFSK